MIKNVKASYEAGKTYAKSHNLGQSNMGITGIVITLGVFFITLALIPTILDNIIGGVGGITNPTLNNTQTDIIEQMGNVFNLAGVLGIVLVAGGIIRVLMNSFSFGGSRERR